MDNLVSVGDLLRAFKAEGINTDDPQFIRALRRAQNPGGCFDCGAHTRMAVPVNPNKPEGPHKLACCGKKV